MAGYEVINLETLKSHGVYPSLDQARGCVEFDRLTAYSIWYGREVTMGGETYFDGEELVEQEEPYVTHFGASTKALRDAIRRDEAEAR